MDLQVYKNKSVLITGGTGFIGSNVSSRLVELGCKVTILYHSPKSLNNIRDILEKAKENGTSIETVNGDIRDEKLLDTLVLNKDIIFNLAAKVSHMDKGVVSYEDLDVNVRGQLTLLEACRKNNTKTKIVFSSTRTVYSDTATNPIDESAPTEPLTLYGLHKLTAEKYHLMYFAKYGIRSTILRIGNPYGDRQHLSNGLYSLPGYFLNKAINGETTEILSNGKQLRDYMYIGDLVETLLRVGLAENTNGKVYNCGSGIPHTFSDMINTIEKVVNKGRFIYAKNPTNENTAIRDSYYLNVNALTKDINFVPQTSLQNGVEKMYAFAQQHPLQK